MKWGGEHRPVARWLPAVIVARFDRVADWLDVEVGHAFGFTIERWDILNVVVMFACALIYAWTLGAWAYVIIGGLFYILVWMAFAWML